MLRMKNSTTGRRSKVVSVGVSIIAVLALTLGFLVGATPSGTAAEAPAKPAATSVGSNAVQMTWSPVTGATHYLVQYSDKSAIAAGSPTVLVTEPSAVVEGLKVNTAYYFKVAVADASGSTTGNTWSATVSATPKDVYAAPTGILIDNIGGKSIELSWTAISGGPGYRAVATAGKDSFSASTLSTRVVIGGLKKSTKYSIQVFVEQPATNGLPALILGPGSKAVQVTTSNLDLAAPANFRVTKQASTSLDLAWDAPNDMDPSYAYEVQYALDSGMKTSLKSAKSAAGAQAMTVTGLSNNTNYYMRVRVVDSKGTVKSDTSDFILGKTRVPVGTIKGTVTGAPSGDVVVAAHTTGGQLVDQVDVKSNGSYELKVRPGSYYVYATYLGSGDYTSLWAASGKDGGRITSEATAIKVTENNNSNAPAITLGKGAKISGTIKDSTGKAIQAVDVTALSAHTSAREVVTLVRGDSSGNYELRGLPDGQYWLRMIYSGDGFNTRSIWVDIKNGQMAAFRVSTQSTATSVSGVTALNATLDNAPFRKAYKAYISGTKKVGKTLTASATEWLAGSYPTTRAKMTFQWKRNGAAISGATGTKYKLTSADKGKNISVTATATRYGYQTGSATSKAYKVK